MVYLDVTHFDGEKLKLRFPRIYQTCREYGLDMTHDLIPTRPAAHYAMGGVRTDLNARASLPGLYAAAKPPAPECTEAIAWRAIPCWKVWFLERAQAAAWPKKVRRET